MTLHITASGTFWLYAGILFLGLVFVVFMVPETKGLKLEDVQKLFMGDQRAYRRAESAPKSRDSGEDEYAGSSSDGDSAKSVVVGSSSAQRRQSTNRQIGLCLLAGVRGMDTYTLTTDVLYFDDGNAAATATATIGSSIDRHVTVI
ncbi:hypothetical protein LPJ73_000283 [Coemansia sp. RSA 2703]|nr:hypothetical protein LPJ73_000283 [Coemansia sp. RSA 2703]